VIHGRLVLDQAALRQLRQARSLSQEELANACFEQRVRVSVSSIKRAEAGHPVLFRIARELARYFDVPVTQLTGGVAEEPAATDAPAPTSPATPGPALVGRTRELARIASALDDEVLAGRGVVVLLQGEPGIGKSCLLAECMRLANARGVTTAIQYVQNQAGRPWFHPLSGIARVLTGLAPSDAALPDPRFDAMAGQLGLSDEERLHLSYFLERALAPELQRLQEGLDYAARRAGENQLLMRLFEHYGRPLVIAVEDVHWADLNLLLVLRHVAAGIASLPVMLVLTSRPNHGAWEEVWGSGLMNTSRLTLDLTRLDAAEADALAARFPQVPAAFRSHCIRLAEGNPLFLEQLLLNYSSASDALPQSIRNHIVYKLAQCDGADRAALEAASAMGESFSLDAVRAVTGDANYQAQALVDHHLASAGADGELTFCHALIRQSVYASLGREDKLRLHGRIAGWYRDRNPTLHARHLEQADRLSAPQAYLSAAEAMYEQRNYVDALTLVDQALNLAVPRADRYQLVRLKGVLLTLLNLPEKSILYLLEACELAQDDQQRCHAWCELADAYLAIGRYADAQRALRRVEQLPAASARQRARILGLRSSLGMEAQAGQEAAGGLPHMAEAADLQEGVAAILHDLASRIEPRGTQARGARPEIQVGVLHSQTGFLRELEAGVLRATLLAFQEINDQGGLLGRRIVPTVADGRSSETVFMEQAAHLVGCDDIVTLFGCSTSSSRRRVRPLIDDNEHLLFYPFQHEGIEASPHIAYVGPAPNQQALPAVDWLLGKGRSNFLLIGSDYVYPVVTNEVVKDRIASLGGTVVGERYFGMGCRDFREAVDALAQLAPDAVILTIVGLESNYAFLQQLHRARCRMPTVVSLVLSEDDLANIPIEYTAGIYTLFSYFQNIDHPLNQDFVRRYKQRFGDRSRIGGYMESAYVGVFLWAKAVQKAECLDRRAIKLAMKGISHFGPGGMAYMDEENNHVWRHVRVAQVGRDGEYHVAWNSARPVRPEPYPPCKSVDEWHAYLRQLRERWRGRWESLPAAPGGAG
jgi:urea transport system substrate-binding protein